MDLCLFVLSNYGLGDVDGARIWSFCLFAFELFDSSTDAYDCVYGFSGGGFAGMEESYRKQSFGEDVADSSWGGCSVESFSEYAREFVGFDGAPYSF